MNDDTIQEYLQSYSGCTPIMFQQSPAQTKGSEKVNYFNSEGAYFTLLMFFEVKKTNFVITKPFSKPGSKVGLMQGRTVRSVHEPWRFGSAPPWARVHLVCQHFSVVTYCINKQHTFADPARKRPKDKSVKGFSRKEKRALFWTEHIWLGRTMQDQGCLTSTFHLVDLRWSMI